jgi:hypothetical protein
VSPYARASRVSTGVVIEPSGGKRAMTKPSRPQAVGRPRELLASAWV